MPAKNSSKNPIAFVCQHCKKPVYKKESKGHVKKCVAQKCLGAATTAYTINEPLQRIEDTVEPVESFEVDENVAIEDMVNSDAIARECLAESEDLLRSLNDCSTIPAYISTGVRIYFSYITTGITVQECKGQFQVDEYSSQLRKREDLTIDLANKRNQGVIKGWTTDDINKYIDSEVEKVKSSSFDRSATVVAKLVKDFLKVTEYKACMRGCTLFKLSDSECEPCQNCLSESLKKFNLKKKINPTKKQKVYYVHLKEQIKSMFVSNSFRQSLNYSRNYIPTDGTYTDIFDGKDIKSILNKDTQLQANPNNYILYVGIMQDGYNSHVNLNESHSFTLFQVVCYSLSPVLRYKDYSKFQVLIAPGPGKPNMASYMAPIVEELKELYDGFSVNVGGTMYKVYVRLVICTGDSPAVAEAYNMKGSASYFPCRFCLALGTRKAVHMSPEAYRQRTFVNNNINIPASSSNIPPLSSSSSSLIPASSSSSLPSSTLPPSSSNIPPSPSSNIPPSSYPSSSSSHALLSSSASSSSSPNKKRRIAGDSVITTPPVNIVSAAPTVDIPSPATKDGGMYLLHSKPAAERSYSLCTKSEKFYVNNNQKIKKADTGKGHLADKAYGVKGRFPFADFNTFKSMYQSGLDDLHFVNRGIGILIYDLFTTTKYHNRYQQQPTTIPNAQSSLPGGVKLHYVHYPFTLTIPLKNNNIKDYINDEITASRHLIPPYMAGNYEKIGQGTRACDWEDVLLRVIPATVIPLMVCPEARLALNALIHACSVALQWYITEDQLSAMDKSFNYYIKFINECVQHDSLDPNVMTLTNHYCLHVKQVVRACGPLRIISARCLERQIQVAKNLSKSRTNAGMNSQNTCVNMVKANVLKRLYPDWSALHGGGKINCTVEVEKISRPIIPSCAFNPTLHIAQPSNDDAVFGRRQFEISSSLYILSDLDVNNGKYSTVSTVKKSSTSPVNIDPLQTLSLNNIPFLLRTYLRSAGANQDSLPPPPSQVLLFDHIQLTTTYCIPNNTPEVVVSDVHKIFKIKSKLSSVNSNGEFVEDSGQRSRYCIYKKHIHHHGQTVLSVGEIICFIYPVNTSSSYKYPPFAVISPFKNIVHSHINKPPMIHGFKARHLLEVVAVADLLHVVGLQRTYSALLVSAGTYNTVHTTNNRDQYNLFWPRSSLGTGFKYPFRPPVDTDPLRPIATRCEVEL